MKRKLMLVALAMGIGLRRVEFCNVGEKTHQGGGLSRRSDAALATRYLRVKIGSDELHVAVAGAEAAQGIATDEAPAAEAPLNVNLHGAVPGTNLGVGSAAIAAGDYVCGAAAGKFQTMTGIAPGTYYVEGRAVTACEGDGKLFELVTCLPTPVTVAG